MIEFTTGDGSLLRVYIPLTVYTIGAWLTLIVLCSYGVARFLSAEAGHAVITIGHSGGRPGKD